MKNINMKIFKAIENNDVDAVKKIISLDGFDVNEQDKIGRTPMHCAAYFGNTEIIKILVENGADINETNNWGRTPLHISVMNSQLEACKSLIINDADQSIKDDFGLSPSGHALLNKNNECYFMLNSNPESKNGYIKTMTNFINNKFISGEYN
jgi:ankyrin repeat protein